MVDVLLTGEAIQYAGLALLVSLCGMRATIVCIVGCHFGVSCVFNTGFLVMSVFPSIALASPGWSLRVVMIMIFLCRLNVSDQWA